jgi:hypothetical protein
MQAGTPRAIRPILGQRSLAELPGPVLGFSFVVRVLRYNILPGFDRVVKI